MMNTNIILSLLNIIANYTKTGYLVERVIKFINTNIHEIMEEGKQYNQVHNGLMNRNGRLSRCPTGKFERMLVDMLCKLCNWRASKYLTIRASKVMTLLGYSSYKKNPNRFKKMMKNRIKKLHRKRQLNQSSNLRLEAADEEQDEKQIVEEVIFENEVHEDNSTIAEENSTMEEETEDNQEEEEYKENQLTQVDTSDQNSNILDVNNSNSDNNKITGEYDNERDMILGEYFPNSVTSPQANNQMIALPSFVPNDCDLYSNVTYSNNPQYFNNLPEHNNDNPSDDFDNLHFQFPF